MSIRVVLLMTLLCGVLAGCGTKKELNLLSPCIGFSSEANPDCEMRDANGWLGQAN